MRIQVKVNRGDTRRITRNLKIEGIKELQYLVERVRNGVISRTPVDTGLARRSWRVQRIRPDAYRIFNNVHYIGYLDDGHSRQAPQGMVEPTFRSVLDTFERRQRSRR